MPVASIHMPGTLFQKDVKVRRVTTMGHLAAQGLGDPARIKILEVLGQKPMAAEEIAKALGSSGFKKATTTVRHHLETLKEAGLIEVSRMVEVRGAVMKYYSATLRVYTCEPPSADFDSKAAKLVDDTSAKLARILSGIQGDRRFAALAKDGKCSEFLALEIVNAALAKATERKEPQPKKAAS